MIYVAFWQKNREWPWMRRIFPKGPEHLVCDRLFRMSLEFVVISTVDNEMI